MTRHRLNPIDDSLDPNDLFDSVKSKLAQRHNGTAEDGITVDLFPVADEPAPELAPARAESKKAAFYRSRWTRHRAFLLSS